MGLIDADNRYDTLRTNNENRQSLRLQEDLVVAVSRALFSDLGDAS